MDDLMKLIEENIGVGDSIQTQVIKTIIIILVMIILYNSLKRILYKTIEDVKTYYTTKKIVNYISILLTTIMIGRVWFVGVRSVTTFIGLFSAGLAIAMKDLIMNLAGWVYILSRKPFRVGDRIEIDGVSGDVIDIKIFDFTLMETRNWIKADQNTGRVVTIPNRDIFNNPLFSYNDVLPYIWNEIEINLTFESNWKTAKVILQRIADKYAEKVQDGAHESVIEASKKYMIFDENLEAKVYTSANQYGVVLTMRHLFYFKGKRDVKQKIWEEILTSFQERDDIEFAYPTQTIYKRSEDIKSKEE